MKSQDDPDYQARLRYLYDWLADGTELRRLEKLVEQAKAHPAKRHRRYVVRNPDGTVYHRPKSSGPKTSS